MVALLVLYVTRPIRGYSGPVKVADQSGDFGPVHVSPRPSPSHEPFVAPTPFVHPLRSKTLTELQALLQTHDPVAQCEMGLRLAEGIGVPKDPQNAALRTCLGMAQAMNYDVHASMASLESAIEIAPLDFYARLKYGELFFHLRVRIRAEQETQRALELANTSWEISLARTQLAPRALATRRQSSASMPRNRP